MIKKLKTSIKIKLLACITKLLSQIRLALNNININSQECSNAFNSKTKDIKYRLNINVEMQVFTQKTQDKYVDLNNLEMVRCI